MKTQLIRGVTSIKSDQKGAALTIGNFDGVHRGHQALIARVIAKAKEAHCPDMLLTFEPHPFEFFQRDHLTIPRITRFREKFLALSDYGIQHVLLLPFNQTLASMSASDFITEILYYSLGIRHLIVGDDFHFGKKREGNISLLKEFGQIYGFSVESIPTCTQTETRISSTRLRAALKAGDLELAKALLGRPYAMQGRISHGDKIGREWGFPTANIFLHRRLTPITGVFTVLVHGIGNEALPGVANVGIRPTIGGTRTLLEVHLLDFNRMIYGQYVEVEFCHKLREEIRYPTIDLLKQQIARDVEMARAYFGNSYQLRGVK